MAGLTDGSKGYASSQLHLVTLEYELFHDLPVDFCGDWLSQANSNTANACPGDGKYHFTIPYTLPANHDATTWFATGWKGAARIDIRSGPSNQTDMVGTCVMEFHTYTSPSSNKNWRTLPSAAAVTCTLGGIAVVLFCLICVLGGCIPESKGAGRRVAIATEPSLKTPLSDADIVDGKFMFQKMEEGDEAPVRKHTSRWSRLPNYNNLKRNQK
jgi:hypothetical protein